MDFIKKIASWYFSRQALPYWCVLLFDCMVVLLSGIVCIALDHGVYATLDHLFPILCTLSVYLVFFLIGFRLMRTYTGVLRYSSFSDVYRIGIANFIGISCIIVARWFFSFDSVFVPIRSKELIFIFLMATIIMVGSRVMMKFLFEKVLEDKNLKSAFIYGVKEGGIALAKAIRIQVPTRFSLKGFVADDDDMIGHMLQGVEVYRNDDSLIEQMKAKGVKALLVSPLKREELYRRQDMVSSLLDAGINIYTYDVAQKWDGHSDINASQLKEVDIEDLLPRDEIEVDLDAVARLLNGARIMITGSAGSIGSEMVRQIAQFGPERLILVDEAETPQHDVRLMLKREHPELEAVTIVTSITNASRMDNIFKTYRPQYVFHAAAYKHVPMMEDNPSEAVLNNVKGTRLVGSTQFVTTRFGNVLGSNGSVIPLFREQIKKGGPVTVTHPDIIRFFMLIPEACKLVLEAGTMGNGGEIFVFDMGQPVKIADLARRMIRLSGATNVQVEFTGLRDGEKLYEEVLNDEEITKPTFNKKIKIAQVREYDYDEVCRDIDELINISLQYDNMATVRKMKEIVPEYKSQHSVYEALDKA